MRRRKSERQGFELKLEQEFPFMQQKEITDEQWEKGGYSTYDAYGCCVGEGWYDLLRGLCLDITKAYEAANEPVGIVVSQVKEKFGTLRFYCYPVGHNPGCFAFDFIGSGSLRRSPGETDLHRGISKIVRKWEEASGRTCENCGAAAETRTDIGWIKTYCDSCYADVKASRKASAQRKKEREENPELVEAEQKAEMEEKRKQTLTTEDVDGMTDADYLTIPAGVKYIDEAVFDAFSRLKGFRVDKANTTFTAIDEVLFEETQHDNGVRRHLLRYPADKDQDSVSYNIPNGVTSIGSDAFKGCTNVVSVTIPKTVEGVSWGTFSDSGIQSILVDPENRDFTSIDGVLFSKYGTELHAYPPKKELLTRRYNIPEEVNEVWHYAFRNVHNLTSIHIPGNVGFLGNDAFEGCINLIEVDLLKRRFNDNRRVFYKCPRLKYICVHKYEDTSSVGNSIYTNEWVLFDGPVTYTKYPKDGEKIEWVVHRLMRYPEALEQDSYVIPQGITNILEYAFSGQNHLKSITLPASITEIGEGAFERCRVDLVLHCHEDTYAHEYAKSNNMDFELI